MKALKYRGDQELIEEGVDALYERLGPADARRFITLTHSAQDDSVQRHRRWQDNLDTEKFIKQVRRLHRQSRIGRHLRSKAPARSPRKSTEVR